MTALFINPVLTYASQLGLRAFQENDPVQLWPDASVEEVDVAIRAVYRQVLGNAHIMESERLVVAESLIKEGQISVREFVRLVAQSDLYRDRFFSRNSSLRAIELNFKHLLGRAPESAEEIAYHTQLLDREGYFAEIDSYLDSDEYQAAFGEEIVPYYRGYSSLIGKKQVGFNYLLQLLRGFSTSDTTDLLTPKRSRLQQFILRNVPSTVSFLEGAANRAEQPITPLLRAAIASPPVVLTEEEKRLRQKYQQARQAASDWFQPVELCPGNTDAEAEIAIRAVYRQVLGNAHVMESERLVVPESQLKRGETSVREFVRQVAKSELYRSRFFENCYRYRAIELNFKHLLGRAPDDYSEMIYHSNILDERGFEADIDSYLDCDEYQDAFGENLVPFDRGSKTQTGQKLVGFTNTLQLVSGASGSDKDIAGNNRARLNRTIIFNRAYGQSIYTRCIENGITNIQMLLDEVLNPKFGALPVPGSFKPQPQTTQTSSPEYQSLQQTCQEQSETLQQLKAQLSELRGVAGIGAAKIQASPFFVPVPASAEEETAALAGQDYAALEQRSAEQAEQIAQLQQQVAQARSLAAIGEAKLNRWRQKVFR